MEEKRVIRHFSGNAAQRTPTRIFWHTRLTAQADLHLDRTHFTTWGGYGGFAFRAGRELQSDRFHTPGGSHEAVLGEKHAWIALNGLLDGGHKEEVGIAAFVDWEHPRYPFPMYAKSNDGFTFFNPAFLFHAGMDLKAGDELSLRYMVSLVYQRWHPEQLQAEQAFAEGACA